MVTSLGLSGGIRVSAPFDALANGVGDDPACAGHRDRDRVTAPIEVVMWAGVKTRHPEQQLENHNLRGEQARGR